MPEEIDEVVVGRNICAKNWMDQVGESEWMIRDDVFEAVIIGGNLEIFQRLSSMIDGRGRRRCRVSAVRLCLVAIRAHLLHDLLEVSQLLLM